MTCGPIHHLYSSAIILWRTKALEGKAWLHPDHSIWSSVVNISCKILLFKLDNTKFWKQIIDE